MRKTNHQNQLDISLSQVASILQAGKKLTRGAIKKTQKQQKDKQKQKEKEKQKSQRSIDNIIINNNDSNVDSMMNKNQKKKKQKEEKINKINKDSFFKAYLGFPNLQGYLEMEVKSQLQNQTVKYSKKSSSQNVKLSQLPKNQLPHLIKVFLKNFMNQNYEVRRGELRKQKFNQKDQLLIELYNPVNHKMQVRSINKQNGYVLAGMKLVFKRINLQQFKTIFMNEIGSIIKINTKNIKTEKTNKKNQSLNAIERVNNDEKMQLENQQQYQQRQQILQQQQQLEFVQLKDSIQKDNDDLIEQELNQQHVKQNMQTEYTLFSKFCLPNTNYVLWPAIVYETVYGNYTECKQLINQSKYFFHDKEQLKCFQNISVFGLYNESPNSSQRSFSLGNQEDNLAKNFEEITKKIKLNVQKIQKNRLKNKDYEEVPINRIIYLIGSNKFVIQQLLDESILQWTEFSDQTLLQSYIKMTYFSSTFEQLQFSIERLNDFKKTQNQPCKPDEIRLSIDRLSKCTINQNTHICIPLRYSNAQKKVLVLVFQRTNQTQNNLIWLNIENILPNLTVPQILHKHKILLYFSNSQKFDSLSLNQLIFDMYSNYFFKDFPLKNYLLQHFGILQSKSQIISYSQQRCIQCIYPIHDLPYHKCFFCSKFCHQECTSKNLNKSIELNCNQLLEYLNVKQIEGRTKIWICDTCEPCALCLQPVGNKSIQCLKCKNMFHELCGKLKINDTSMIKQKYLCENCIQCEVCEKKLKNLDYAITKNGYQCTSCHKAEQANQICHICKKQGDGRWAQCSREFCGKWIHKYCDKYLQQKNFFSNNNEQPYFCPFCRKVQKRKIILRCIDILTVFDEYQYFTIADYEDILDYKYVIHEPMCFKKMNQRCLDGQYDQNTYDNLMRDFELLINNALKYNMPKDQPHYQARLLNILGRFTFDKIKQIINCTQQELISGILYSKLKDKKRQIFRQVSEYYLEMILNFQSEHSVVEVKRPKEKNQKPLNLLANTNDGDNNQNFVFQSRTILNNFFRSCMLKFKIKNKTPKIENLFQTQKIIQAFKAPIKQNFCYYHYWNSRVTFYCEICMQHYCCVEKCHKHNICSLCGIKGCACDKYKCGCGPLRQKQRKMYEKTIMDRFYDRRELTENYKLCLRCAFEKLNSKVCIYCEKAYQYYYDFQACRVCKKIYHKQCADIHSSSQMSRFFFKKQNNSPQEQLFSESLRLPSTCYECSTSNKLNKQLMYQKLKSQSINRLMKLQKLVKYQYLFWGILHENGIRITLSELANLIFGNYDEFLRLQNLMEEYLMNYAFVKKSVKENQILERQLGDKISGLVKEEEKYSKSKQYKTNNNNNDLPLMTIQSQIQKEQTGKTKQTTKTPSSNSNIPTYTEQQINEQKSPLILLQYPSLIMTLIFKLSQSSSYVPSSLIQFLLRQYQHLTINSRIRKFINSPSEYIISSAINSSGKKSQQKLKLNDLLLSDSFIELKINVIEKIRRDNVIQSSKGVGCLTDFSRKRLCLLCVDIGWNGNLHEKNIERIWGIRDDDYVQEDISYNPIIQEKQQPRKLLYSKQQPKKLFEEEQMCEINNRIDVEQNQVQNQSSTRHEQCPPLKHIPSFQLFSAQRQTMSHHINHTKQSHISSLKRMTTLNKIITKFLLQAFQSSKQVYRRGSTLILKNQVGNWRVLKKGKNNEQTYDIVLKKENKKSGRWLFSVNQNVWMIETVEQMINKLRPIISLHSFRQLADFLGFTFKLVPLQKPSHFTKFLQTHPLDEIDRHSKKDMILQVYDRHEWQKNGVFKNKKSQEGFDQVKEYTVIKKKPFYLKKRNQKKDEDEEILQKKYSNPPYITFEDLKKDLEYQPLGLNTQQLNQSQLNIQQELRRIDILHQKIDNVFIAPSPIHKLGLFAKRFCPKNTIMVEYIGQIVSEALADVRQSKFHFGCYMFGLNRRNVDKKQIIDATYRGNMARYLNHCCDPNCKAKIQVINHQPRIFIYSIRDINQYEELTYDYQFSVDANEKLICTCGAKNCQGRLN